jgi:putative ATP-dependent endonuclease of OLD family
VLTDGDAQEDGTKAGERRVLGLMALLVSDEERESTDDDVLLSIAPNLGLFMGEDTFEMDLFRAGYRASTCRAIRSLTANRSAAARAGEKYGWPDSFDAVALLRDIEQIGKGRFAQRMAGEITKDRCPTYIRQGIEYVANRCT